MRTILSFKMTKKGINILFFNQLPLTLQTITNYIMYKNNGQTTKQVHISSLQTLQ